METLKEVTISNQRKLRDIKVNTIMKTVNIVFRITLDNKLMGGAKFVYYCYV